MNYISGWLTLNRACNLRCKWCYAQGSGYAREQDMNISLAFRLIRIFSELNIHHITLIGGEPLIYPHLFEVLDECGRLGVGCGIVTNGLRCADAEYVKKLTEHGVRSLSLSLKGEDAEKYLAVTGVDGFEKVLAGIQNCMERGIQVSASMVLTEENIENYLTGIEKLKTLGVHRFHLSFCYQFTRQGESPASERSPRELLDKFANSYNALDALTEHAFTLSAGLPLCLWDEGLLRTMTRRGQIKTVCQLLAKSGLIFDEMGNIIPCNAMPFIQLGQVDKEFFDAPSLLRHIEQDPHVRKAYAKLCALPDRSCESCRLATRCRGGCVCRWTNYDFQTLMAHTGGTNENR